MGFVMELCFHQKLKGRQTTKMSISRREMNILHEYFANEMILRIGNFSLGKKFGSELAYCLHN